jgi:hypothetical protein
MKNGAAAGIKQTTYGVSIGAFPYKLPKLGNESILTPNSSDNPQKDNSHNSIFEY